MWLVHLPLQGCGCTRMLCERSRWLLLTCMLSNRISYSRSSLMSAPAECFVTCARTSS